MAEVVSCHSVDQWKEHIGREEKSGKVVVVDFTASWCGPCRFIAPILADLAKKHPNLLFLKVDVDELKTVAEEHKIDAMPTFVFLKNGEEAERVVGARKEALVELVVKYSAEHSNDSAPETTPETTSEPAPETTSEPAPETTSETTPSSS